MLDFIRSFKRHYVALLTVYFAVGFAGLSSVTNTFFIKNQLSLTPVDLISISIWTSLPWSIKMVFGAFIDSVKIFGSNRKAYIYLGQILVVLGMLGLVDHASSKMLISHLGEYTALLISGLLTITGVVISDIVVDTMAIEITKDQTELGYIQVWTRVAQSTGGLLGAALTGYLASAFEPSLVFSLALICPLIAFIGTIFTPIHQKVQSSPLDKKVVLGGLLFGLVSIFSGMLSKDYGTLIMLVISLGILIYLFKQLTLTKTFIFAMIALFLYRASPGVGPSLSWFYMDELGFNEMFFGKLSFIASLASVITLVFLAKIISSGDVFKSLVVIAILGVILSLPDVLVFYDIFGSRMYAEQIVLIDSGLMVPILNLSMIPLGIIIAKSAPAAQRAVYISLTASLMNLALVAGDVMSQLLNKTFVVTREDFTLLGPLMVSTISIGILLSIFATVFLYKTNRRIV